MEQKNKVGVKTGRPKGSTKVDYYYLNFGINQEEKNLIDGIF